METRVHVDGGPATRKFFHHQNSRPSTPPSQQPQKSETGTVHKLLAGGIARAFGKTCTAPLGRITILFQVQGMHSDVAIMSKPSIWREALRIANEEGFRAFWKGNLVTIAHRLPYSAVSFYAYEQYKIVVAFPRWWLGRNDCSFCNISIGSYQDAAHGTGSRIRNAIYNQGMGHAVHTICRDEGFLGLYKGLGATLLGIGPNIAISFAVYESLGSYCKSQRPNDSTAVVSLASRSLSAIASSTVTFPLDLVRRRMQLEGAAGQARVYNNGLFGTFRHIICTEGFRGLYRGIMPEYYKVVPSLGIVFLTYETLKKLLSQGPFC